MMSLDSTKVFVKGLSLNFLQTSKEFKDMTDPQKKEYARQYDAMKERFLEYLEKGEEEPEEDPMIDEEMMAQMEEEAMMSAAMGETGEQSVDQNLITLKGTAEAEAEQESQVMEAFRCLNPLQKTTNLLESKLELNPNNSSLLNSKNIQGNSNSSKLFTVAGNFNTLFNNFSGESGSSSIIPTSTQNVFDSIVASTNEIYTTTPNAILSNEAYTTPQPSTDPDDYKQTPDNSPALLVNTEEVEDNSKVFDVIVARYTTDDEVFARTWEIPDEYERSNEIEKVKDNVVTNLVGVINTEDSLDKLENKEEETFKLSVESAVDYLENNEVI